MGFQEVDELREMIRIALERERGCEVRAVRRERLFHRRPYLRAASGFLAGGERRLVRIPAARDHVLGLRRAVGMAARCEQQQEHGATHAAFLAQFIAARTSAGFAEGWPTGFVMSTASGTWVRGAFARPSDFALR